MNDEPGRFAKDWASLVSHVREESSDLVLLSEMPFHYWFAASPKYDRKVWQEAVRAHNDWMKRLSELGSAVVLGSRPINIGGRRLNQGFVWTAGGRARGVHLKSYLPDEGGYYEASWYDRGDRSFTPFRAAGVKAGFMICSDIWSMAHARRYGKERVELIAVPRATPKATTEKWLAGGKVAAVVSGAFCISSNRAGRRGEATFGGCGWVIGPDAQPLGLTSKDEPFVTVDLDLSMARKAKKTYPRDALNPD